MTQETIKKIDYALTKHSLNDNYTNEYLKIMDSLALLYDGNTKSDKLCALLSDYNKAVNVSTFSEAFDRAIKIA